MQGLPAQLGENWAATDTLLYRRPMGSILRGVVFSAPRHGSPHFEVDLFVRPLYVPFAGPFLA